ncbi:MAG: alcohol dehydrogenase catalytic domain-containing protein, partial [Actinocatenispora sp.]
MKAIVAHGPRRFDLAEVTRPEPLGDGGRVLAVEAAGVCAADRMLWRGTGPWQVRWPFTPGHEVLGRDVETGERFTVEVSIPCGRCPRCRAGRTNLCPHGRHVGSDVPGGFAEYVALPPDALVHRVPDDVPLAQAVLAEPLACAVHAVRRAGVSAGDTVAVIGLGAVGA